MSWEEAHRIKELESKLRKLEDRVAALEARQVLTVRGPAISEPLPLELGPLVAYTRGSRNDV